MKDVIANLDNDWQLTSDEVNAYLRRPRRGQLERGTEGVRML